MDFFDLMLKPFLACLILAGMHAYLGLHVVKRGVIFVDLALAQVAAFGATVGFIFGWSLHSTSSYFCSLGFTFVGAAVLSLTRLKEPIVPQEALIGVIYAVFAAATVIVLSYAPDGGEELRALMVGHLLFVDWAEIIKIFVLYTVIAVFHYFFRRQFLAISESAESARDRGMNIKVWDFMFYASFGLVVTSSTELAGVLLVFSFLIVPAICGVLLSSTNAGRLTVGWVVGVLTSVLGILASYYFDTPTGATVVCVFGFILIACFFIRSLMHPKSEAAL